METMPNEGFSDVETYYQDLSPLDRSREVYLFTSFIAEEISLASRWGHEQDIVRRDYARSVGDYVNATISNTDTSEEIEDIIVRHICFETQERWQAYSVRIDTANKSQICLDQLSEDKTVTCDPVKKAKQVRDSWQKYLDDYGLVGAEFNPNVRAEFVRNKIIWDTAKESIFLHSVLTTDQTKAAA